MKQEFNKMRPLSHEKREIGNLLYLLKSSPSLITKNTQLVNELL